MGYTHITVNHSKELMNKANAAFTNCIESQWCHAKVYMPKYGVHRGLNAGYLAEFMWRGMNINKDKFLQLINDMNSTFQLKYLHKTPIFS